MLEAILPAGVVVEETREEIEVELFAEEEAAVARAVEKRRREFVTGRACARRALARLDLPPQAIPPGAKGAPTWPAGVVGSITHCDGYRACAVARAADLAALGVDAEPDEPLPDGVLETIALREERKMLRVLSSDSTALSWDRLLFCMKEATYKAWFPLAGRWLSFEDATIEIDPVAGSFSVQLLVPGPPLGDRELRGFSGRWLARDGLVLAAIAHPSTHTQRA